MKKFEQTPVKGVLAIYTINKIASKNGKKRVKVICRLFAEEDHSSLDISAQITGKPEQEIGDLKKISMNRSIEKFNQQLLAHLANNPNTHYFSNLWNHLTDAEKLECISEKHKLEKDKRPIITYFEKNVLPRLDRFGPYITADQCRQISHSLYVDYLENKKYKGKSLDKKKAESLINEFLDALAGWLKNSGGTATGTRPSAKKIDELISDIFDDIDGEDRLKALFSYYLQRSGTAAALDALTFRIDADPILQDYLTLRNSEIREKLGVSIVFILRELCGNAEAAKRGTNVHIGDMNILLDNFAKIAPAGFPVVRIPELISHGTPQTELAKEFFTKHRVRFSEILLRKAERSSYAAAAAIMLTSGPRIEEVCALKFGDILPYQSAGIAPILYTATGQIIASDGKTKGFRRTIFIPTFAMHLIRLRIEGLKTFGYSDEEIKNAFIACDITDIASPLNLHRFSACVKSDMHAAGFDDEYFSAVSALMDSETDVAFNGKAEVFDTAYGLRRDAISMMVNVGKLPPHLVESIVGHKLPRGAQRWDKIITRDDEWPAILAMLERIVYLSQFSAHPYFSPVCPSQAGKPELLPVDHQAISVLIPADRIVRVRVRTKGCSSVFVDGAASGQISLTKQTEIVPAYNSGTIVLPDYLSDFQFLSQVRATEAALQRKVRDPFTKGNCGSC